jgi:membrane protein DedA with SNARE-associated domain
VPTTSPRPAADPAPHSSTRRDSRPSRAYLDAHAWVLDHWPETGRRRFAVVVTLVALVLGTIAAFHPAAALVTALDPLAYTGLVVVCWIGAGGALVPIPGVRYVSWFMVAHQGAYMDPLVVAPLAAAAMALGQTSYYAAARVGADRVKARLGRREGHRTSGGGADGAAPPGVAVPDEAASSGAATPPHGHRSILDRAPTPIRRAMTTAKDAITRLLDVHPRRAIFLVSVFPTPLTTFAAASAGALGVRFTPFFVAAFAGFLVLASVLAILGQGILRALGISTP